MTTELIWMLAVTLVAAEGVHAETKWKLAWSDEFDAAGRPEPGRLITCESISRPSEQRYLTMKLHEGGGLAPRISDFRFQISNFKFQIRAAAQERQRAIGRSRRQELRKF